MASITISADYTEDCRLGQFATADWSTAWASATGTVTDGYPSSDITQTSNTIATYVSLFRTPLFFGTSALENAIISSVTLRLYGHTHGDMDEVVIQNGQPTYPSYPIVSGDYNKAHYSGDGGSKLIDDFVNDGWNEIALNAGALAWINKTGQTKLMLRVASDIAGTEPVIGESRWVRFRSGASESNLRPQLVISHVGSGYIWTEGDKFHFTSDIREQEILGVDTTTDATAGHLSVEGNYVHFISQNGDERRQMGKLTNRWGYVAGHIWIDDMWIYYIDSSGYERKLGTWMLGQSHLGVDTILHA